MYIETVQAYLKRKHDELRLLNDCLKSPLLLTCPRSVDEAIRCKFQLTAALKAQYALEHWAVTETAWAKSGQPGSGPFSFSYDYQRADLDVDGPSFYDFGGDSTSETVYTASGMAAISALLLALARVIEKADIFVLPGSYGETLELIESYASHLRLVAMNRAVKGIASTSPLRILLLDSCAPGNGFEATLSGTNPALDLLVFDTTCFSGRSGRVRRALNWARKWDVPVVMVRSHTKLDSLGAEYGRLGSAAFVVWQRDTPWASHSKFEKLPSEMRDAVRLFGGAALPAHFPPYVSAPIYRNLTNKRMAAILRNSRRSSRYFASTLPMLTEELRFAHGLYVTLRSPGRLDEAQQGKRLRR
jgi:hypothetical protein